MNEENQEPKEAVTENKLWKKISQYALKAGTKTIYTALLMWFAFKRKDTPAWAKRVIMGVLAYFVAPFDMIPDLTPFIGFTDDLGVLSIGLVTIAAYINDDIRTKARTQLTKWFDKVDEKELNEIDDSL